MTALETLTHPVTIYLSPSLSFLRPIAFFAQIIRFFLSESDLKFEQHAKETRLLGHTESARSPNSTGWFREAAILQ